MTVAPAWTPYCGAAPAPEAWLSRWNFDPPLMVGLAVALGLSFWLLRGRRRASALAATGLAALVFVSPLCALSSALFSARTVHHILLVAGVAPLVAAACPLRAARRSPVILATLAQAAVFWAWHAPAAYGWALSSDLAYWLMQASLLGSAIWFWRAVRAADSLAAVAGLLVAMVLMGLLGAVLTFAPSPAYAPHLLPAETWGLGALRDQQLAGLIMWAPAAALYLAAALWRLAGELGPAKATAAA